MQWKTTEDGKNSEDKLNYGERIVKIRNIVYKKQKREKNMKTELENNIDNNR